MRMDDFNPKLPELFVEPPRKQARPQEGAAYRWIHFSVAAGIGEVECLRCLHRRLATRAELDAGRFVACRGCG